MPAAIAQSAIAPVLAEPRVRAEQVTQLVLGETATLGERTGDWRRVCTHFDGYDGWVNAGYLREVEDQLAEDWRSRASAWSEGATVSIGGSHLPLPLRARVILEQDAVVLPDGRRGRITDGRVREMREVAVSARAKAPERWAFE
ncbi:MAG TPA: SH3 domain-containing protein, partial [Gemmatimonadales bacterium]